MARIKDLLERERAELDAASDETIKEVAAGKFDLQVLGPMINGSTTPRWKTCGLTRLRTARRRLPSNAQKLGNARQDLNGLICDTELDAQNCFAFKYALFFIMTSQVMLFFRF